MAAAKAPEAEPKTLEVQSNDTLEIIDNTDIQAAPEAPVESEEVELFPGLTQVNYR